MPFRLAISPATIQACYNTNLRGWVVSRGMTFKEREYPTRTEISIYNNPTGGSGLKAQRALNNCEVQRHPQSRDKHTKRIHHQSPKLGTTRKDQVKSEKVKTKLKHHASQSAKQVPIPTRSITMWVNMQGQTEWQNETGVSAKMRHSTCKN
jgi:hypothetical protein